MSTATETTSRLSSWIRQLEVAEKILGDVRPLGVSDHFGGSLRIQLAIEDFRRLFAGQKAKREEHKGSNHFSIDESGVTFIACEAITAIPQVVEVEV